MNELEIEERLHREEIELAPINKRVIAFTIDEIIISFLVAVIVWDQLKVLKTPEAMMNYTSSIFFYIMGIKILYQAVFVSMYGATLGKMAMKIKVIDAEYLGLPSISESIIRAVVRVISEAVFYFGFLVASFSPVKLTWHDRAAKTLVVDA